MKWQHIDDQKNSSKNVNKTGTRTKEDPYFKVLSTSFLIILVVIWMFLIAECSSTSISLFNNKSNYAVAQPTVPKN